MPLGTAVSDCVEDVKKKGTGDPYAICQASTGESYATGKKLAECLKRHCDATDRRKFKEALKRYCESGPNAGKPGPCPGGGGEHHPAAVEAVKRITAMPHNKNLTPDQMESQGANQYFNQTSLSKAFPGRKGHQAAGKAVRAAYEAGAHLS
jgi:hypothetical protein